MSLQKVNSIFVLLIVTLIYGCAAKFDNARRYSSQDEWLKSVVELRKQSRDDPDSIEVKSLLHQTEIKAAEFYYQRGKTLLLSNEFDEALIQFQQGLIAMPSHDKNKQYMNEALARKKSVTLYEEAFRNYQLNNIADAKALLNKSRDLYPNYEDAELLLKKIIAVEEDDIDKGFSVKSRKPITLRFKDTKLKTAFEFIVNAYGVNMIFDDDLQDIPVNLYAKSLNFEQAMSLLQRTSKTFYKIIGDNTILVASDTDEKRNQYEDHLIRVFNLKSIEAKVMADVLKGVIGSKNVIINDAMNTLIIRDTEEGISLAETLVSINDRKPAEMILEVEILEVNRTKTELLGLDFGSKMSISYPSFVGGGLQDALNAGTVTLPNVVLNYFKSDVDAKTLANPRIRVADNKSAKIHIGDRVPLRASTVQDATGQTRTTYEYRDIGIRLQVDPDIQIDNSISVKLALEVSSLGQNLGTADEPAFSIGTRNTETTMILKDGETAILGGLIRDEERRNRIKVPGLGDIPIIGNLFTQFDDQNIRTDVLLTITPRIVRSWDVTPELNKSIFSGTRKNFSTKPVFGYQVGVSGESPIVKIDSATTMTKSTSNIYTTPNAALNFDEPLYLVGANEEFDVAVVLVGDDSVKYMNVEMLFNPELIEYMSYSSADSLDSHFDIRVDDETGVINLSVNDIDDLTRMDGSVLATLKMKGKRSGVSYLMNKTTGYLNNDGIQQRVQSNVSRIIIK